MEKSTRGIPEVASSAFGMQQHNLTLVSAIKPMVGYVGDAGSWHLAGS